MTFQGSLRSWRGCLVLTTFLLIGTAGMQPGAAWGQSPPPAPTPVPDNATTQDASASSPDQTDPQGGQVLTRGAIHEAFAAPVVHDPAASPIIPKTPPAPIQEMPPDQKPAGQNVQWISGYWSWDVSRDDFIWISGIWREPPPNNQWVPGYWHQVDGGSQWVPGTWIPVGTGQTQSQPSYLPPPPQSLEAGPNTPAPAANLSWTPGFWSWQGSAYAWRPGFWAAVQPNWIWMPAHYVWTPGGHLFVAGYWDLPIANRGLMFAPVYYPQPVYAQPNFVFTPSISIVGPAVTANLFVQANAGQYLFGNYYPQNFLSVGITPWFSFTFASGPPVFYDPLFSYYAVINVQRNPAWVTQVREQYIQRRENVALRPPVTYIEQTRVIERNVTINRNVTVVDHRMLAMPLNRMAADPVAGKGMRLVQVHEAEREQIRRQAAQLHEFREQRLQTEREGARAKAAGGAAAARPRPMNLPHSPVGSHRAGASGAMAQRGLEQRSAGSHPEAARRVDMHSQAAGTSEPARATRPARPATAPRTAERERPAPGGQNGLRRFNQGTAKPATRQPSRPSPERARGRENEEEERRRSP
jgi:WXXGXW repeat (2 copies)